MKKMNCSFVAVLLVLAASVVPAGALAGAPAPPVPAAPAPAPARTAVRPAAPVPAAVPTPKVVAPTPRDATQETLKRMTEELRLDAEQQKQVKAALETHEGRIRDMRSDKSLTPQDFGIRGREARAENDKRLREVLTAEQYQKWQKILAQRAQTRRRMEQPVGGGAIPQAPRAPGQVPAPAPAPAPAGGEKAAETKK